MPDPKLVQITVTLTQKEAYEYSVFLHRIPFSAYLDQTDGNSNTDEAYVMKEAGAKIREALADAGYLPR
jgi:hypothetical protein